jgi:hypothetical protein
MKLHSTAILLMLLKIFLFNFFSFTSLPPTGDLILFPDKVNVNEQNPNINCLSPSVHLMISEENIPF